METVQVEEPQTESASTRRLGDLLVEASLITREQLTEALRIQRTLNTYQPLGQVLLNQGWLTRRQLATVLRRHRMSARLGDLLVRAKRITPEQLATALAQQKASRQPLGQVLRGLGYVTEHTIREALCTQLHVNFFDLDRVRIDRALARLVSEKYALRRRVVPLCQAGHTLVVAMDDPGDLATIAELEQLLGRRVEVVTSTGAKIERAIKRLYADEPIAADLTREHNVLVGTVRDHEVAELAARALHVRLLPPGWQCA